MDDDRIDPASQPTWLVMPSGDAACPWVFLRPARKGRPKGRLVVIGAGVTEAAAWRCAQVNAAAGPPYDADTRRFRRMGGF